MGLLMLTESYNVIEGW